MKKNLLTLMFVFSFVFLGMLVTKAEAANGSMRNIKRSQSLSFKDNKSLSAKFSTKYAKLKKLCETKRADPCTVALISATAWADFGMWVCDTQGLYSTACDVAEAIAFYELDYAISVCAAQQAVEVRKRESHPTLDSPRSVRETATS